MELVNMSLRLSAKMKKQLQKESKESGRSLSEYTNGLLDQAMQHTVKERLVLLDQHDILLEAVRVLSRLIQSTEKYLRQYDFEDPDISIMEKLFREIRIKMQSKSEGK